MEMVGGVNASSESIEKLLSELAKEKPQSFSYEQLHSFTSDFKYKLGSGGFGDVYRGEFPDSLQIAVKVLKNNTRDVMEKQFRSEVGTTGRTYHRNLIKLYGYCNDAKLLALVYEYMENGSFDKILFKNHLDIQWVKLYDIAIDIAKGISYLHESQIIHHDIKPGNVLLDSKLSPKVTDFGLARVNRELSLFTQSGFRGSTGYAAPEVFMGTQVKISSKCDVFSFGMMLFDIIGSKRKSKTQEWLPGQVWVHFEKKRLDIIVRDCGIGKEDEIDAKTLCVIALLCAQHDPHNRPSMSTVIKLLEGEIPPWTPVNPFPYYDYSSESNTRGNSTSARRRGESPMSESSATGRSTGTTRRRGQAPVSESSATGTTCHGQPPMLSRTFDKREARGSIPPAFERKDPPLDENPVILYRTLGDRRNYIISTLLQMHRVLNLERDFHTPPLKDDHRMQIEMFMGKDQRIPVLFVKGKLIGGPDEVLKLEKEGKLRALFDGVPKDQFIEESWKTMSEIYNRRNQEMLDKYFPQLFKSRCTLM